MFDESVWDNLWMALLYVAVSVVASLLLIGAVADHSVRGYYIGPGSNATCVVASINWDTDVAVFCSDDVQKALAVMKEANAALKH